MFCLFYCFAAVCVKASPGRECENQNICAPHSWWRSNTLSYEQKEFLAPWKYNGTAPWFISMHHKLFQAPPPLPLPPALRFAFAVPQVLFERCTDGRFQLYSQLAVGFHVRAAFSAHRRSNRPLPSVKGQQGVSKRCRVKANHFFFDSGDGEKTKEQRWTAKCVGDTSSGTMTADCS